MARQSHIRKGDTVVVIAGSNKGKRGKVLRVVGERVVIEKVAMIKRHMKPSQKNPQGGRLSKEMPVDVSNVLLIDPQTNEPTRVGVRYTDDGRKELYAKKSGAKIRDLSKPRKAYAKKK